MTKVCIISDLHFGNKKNNEIFLNNTIDTINNEIVPYLKKNDIQEIYILGDLFDSRNTINVKIKNAVYNLFDNELKNFSITMILGNHDIFHKSSTEIHSLKMFKKFDNVKLIEDIELNEVDGRKFLFVPWQVNYGEFKARVANKNFYCDACFGHFDINNCYMNKLSSVTKDGLDQDLFFNNYGMTWSGHFHLRSITKRNNTEIIYVGTINELNRNDKNEPKGFAVLNTEDMSYEFIDTKNYIKFVDITYPEKPSKKLINNNIVDIHVTIDKDFSDLKYQSYLKSINELNPVDVNIVTKYAIFNENNIEVNEEYTAKPLMESVEDYVREVLDLSEEDKQEIYNKLNELYNEVKQI